MQALTGMLGIPASIGMTGAIIIGIVLLSAGLIYGIFFSSAKALRVIVVIAALGLALLFASGIGRVIDKAKAYRDEKQKEVVQAQEQLVADFIPEVIDPGAIEPFKAILKINESRSIADFTILGPDLKSAIDVNNIEKLAYDPQNDSYYALDKWGDLGKINLTNKNFEKVNPDAALKDYSWPKGIAFNPDGNEVIILTSHVFSNLFSYNVNSHEWKKMTAGLRNVDLVALTYSESDQVFYALEKAYNAASLSSIAVFNRNGAHIGSIKISPQIPINSAADASIPDIQMNVSSGKIILIVASSYLRPEILAQSNIFAIDPQSGKVSIAQK